MFAIRFIFIAGLALTSYQAGAAKINGMNPALWQKVNPSSSSSEWQQASPGNGGTCWYLAIHPQDPDCIIESCDMGGTYISFDGSKKYQSMNNPDWDFYNRIHNINSVDFCSSNPEIGYAGCEKNGLFKTKDKGHSWQPLKTDVLDKLYKPAFNRAMICSVAVNPDNPDEVWLGLGRAPRLTLAYEKDRNVRIPRGIAFSKDGGKSWKHLPDAFPQNAMCRKIIISPDKWSIGKVIFACTDDGLYLSSDEGKSWQKKNGSEKNKLPHSVLHDLDAIYDSSTGKVILAVCMLSKAELKNGKIEFKGGIWRSSDLGKNWHNMTGNLNFPASLIMNTPDARSGMADPCWQIIPKLQFFEFLAVPEYKKIYLNSFKGLKDNSTLRKVWKDFCSKQSKFSQAKVKKYLNNSKYILPDFHNIRIDPRNPDIVYTSIHSIWVPYGVWKTRNGGKKWICTVRGAQGWGDPAWKSYRPTGKPVFNVKQVWTKEQLMNWGTPKMSFGLWDVRTFDLSKGNPDLLYFHTHRVTYRSNDGGETWQDATNHFVAGSNGGFMGNGDCNMCFFGFAFHPKNPERMLAWTADCGIMTSNDGGRAWKSVKGASWGSNQWVHAAAFDPDNTNRFYLFLDCKDWITNLKGNYFIESDDFGKSCKGVQIDQNGRVVKHPPAISAFSGSINRLLVDPNSPKNKRRFIAAHSIVTRKMISSGGAAMSQDGSKGILISEDGGITWKQSNKGIGKNLDIIDLVATPGDFKTLYAAAFMKFKMGGKRPQVIPGGLFVSKNSGSSWNKLESMPLKAPGNIVISKDGTIYVCGGYKREYDRNGGIYRSTDKGKSWQQILAAPCVPAMAVSPDDPQLMYCVIDGLQRPDVKSPGIWRSEDGGTTWERVNHGLATNSYFTEAGFKPGAKDAAWIATYGSGLYRNIKTK